MGRLQYIRIITVVGALLVGAWLPLRLIGFEIPIQLLALDCLVAVVSVLGAYLSFQSRGETMSDWRNWVKPRIALDLIFVTPLTLLSIFFSGAPITCILLIKLLIVGHIRHLKSFLDYFDSLQPITYRLTPLVVLLPLLVHIIACGWIALGSGTAEGGTDATLTYVKAVYWTFTTLTTVGYGDITAKTISQMLFSCGVQVVGVGVFGFILSNVAGVLARSDAAREHHMDNLDKIETFMKLHHTPNELRSKIRAYYHYMWENKKGYQENSLVGDLPSKIQSELFMHINKAIVEKVSFLRGADPEFVEEIMSELKPRILVPGAKVFLVDDPGDGLYFVQNGRVEIIGKNGELLSTLRDGSVFGEMALISDKPRTATALSSTFCDVYFLSKTSFVKVMTAHPHFREHLEEVVRARQAA